MGLPQGAPHKTAGGPGVPPLRHIRRPSLFRRGRPQTGPTVYAPGAFARQTQAQKWNRTGGNFCKPRAQWPGRNRGKPLRFCAPEIFCPSQGITPRNGGSRGRAAWRREALPNRRLRPPPSVFWFLFHVEKKPAPQGGTFSRLTKIQSRRDAAGASPRPTKLHRKNMPSSRITWKHV